MHRLQLDSALLECSAQLSLLGSRLNRSTQHILLDRKMECIHYFPKRADLSVSTKAHLIRCQFIMHPTEVENCSN
jgi:hypothetical protein